MSVFLAFHRIAVRVDFCPIFRRVISHKTRSQRIFVIGGNRRIGIGIGTCARFGSCEILKLRFAFYSAIYIRNRIRHSISPGKIHRLCTAAIYVEIYCFHRTVRRHRIKENRVYRRTRIASIIESDNYRTFHSKTRIHAAIGIRYSFGKDKISAFIRDGNVHFRVQRRLMRIRRAEIERNNVPLVVVYGNRKFQFATFEENTRRAYVFARIVLIIEVDIHQLFQVSLIFIFYPRLRLSLRNRQLLVIPHTARAGQSNTAYPRSVLNVMRTLLTFKRRIIFLKRIFGVYQL